MVLDALSEIARQEWFRMAELRLYVRLMEEDFIAMPNQLDPHPPLHPGQSAQLDWE